MQLCDLTLQYDGVRVLEHLNLTLPDSGLVCIFAPSGTGKTTLLNLFCGLLKPGQRKDRRAGGQKICLCVSGGPTGAAADGKGKYPAGDGAAG